MGVEHVNEDELGPFFPPPPPRACMWGVCSDLLAAQVFVALLRVSVVNRDFCGLLKFWNGVRIGSFPSCVLHKKSDEK